MVNLVADFLRKGIIKRIGPCDSIDIWAGNWIQGIPSLKPRVRLEETNVNRVCDLFMPNSRCWNEQLIMSSFITMDAEEIIKLKPGTPMLRRYVYMGLGATWFILGAIGILCTEIRSS